MHQGIRAVGDNVRVMYSTHYNSPTADLAIFYGLAYGLKSIMEEYLAAGKQTILIDLGYFGRNAGGKLKGYHRFAINGLHPNDDQLNYVGKECRFTKFGIKLKPYGPREGAILVAGMSEKAAWVYGLKPEEWERKGIKKLSKYKDDIIYRPKPSWKGASKIPGAEYSVNESLEEVFKRTAFIWTHHSNVAIDGLIEGIRSDVVTGVMYKLSCQSKDHPTDEERLQFLTALSYCQWDVHEMTTGRAWRFLRENFL